MLPDVMNGVRSLSEKVANGGLWVTVPDWLMKSRLAGHLRDSPTVKEFALYGYGSALRLSFTVQFAKLIVEQTYELAVDELIWEASRRELVFTVTKLTTRFKRWYHRLFVGSLAGLPALVIPFVGGAIGSLLVDQLVEVCSQKEFRPRASATAAALLEGNRLVVNLTALTHPQLAAAIDPLLRAVKPVEWLVNRDGLRVRFGIGDESGETLDHLRQLARAGEGFLEALRALPASAPEAPALTESGSGGNSTPVRAKWQKRLGQLFTGRRTKR